MPLRMMCNPLFVSNGREAATALVGRLTVRPTARIVNLSTRALVEGGERLTLGFVVAGSGASPMLLRAVGPGLQPFLPGTQLAGDPRLEIYDAARNLVEANDNWGGGAALVESFIRGGAFALAENSRDAAAAPVLLGPATAQIVSPSGGVVLAELYDLGDKRHDPAVDAPPPRLKNISVRYRITTQRSLAAGVAVQGVGPIRLLIRGVGPTLRSSFGLGDVLADPKLEIYDSNGRKIAENNDWNSLAAEPAVRAGAFALADRSKDAAMVLTVEAGVYTAVLGTADGAAGEALLEVFEFAL